ncbi:TetR/AcrR family transcriptional regulator [Cohnella sp.]|uniref:TetR/AcrR family transcriptional regulator n=1 Tax=Cohnella sp. TaxID=1883426 RepID=UPI0037048A94
MNAKERIVQAAAVLFNEQGTGKVSTNHIAAAAHMSPGNLYYHYKNKEEIIEAILDRMYAEWNPVWELPDEPVTRQTLHDRLLRNFEILWQYRFFYREAVALLQADERLKRKHIRMTESRMAEQDRFAHRFVVDGVLRFPEGFADVRKLITACWIVANNWLAFLEMNGEAVDARSFGEGLELIWTILGPYLAEGETGK